MKTIILALRKKCIFKTQIEFLHQFFFSTAISTSYVVTATVQLLPKSYFPRVYIFIAENIDPKNRVTHDFVCGVRRYTLISIIEPPDLTVTVQTYQYICLPDSRIR